MSELDEIRARVQAVKGVEWKVWRDETEQELWSRFIGVGPFIIPALDDPEGERKPEWQEEARRAVARQEALVDFLTHAAADLETLLAKLEPASPKLSFEAVGPF